MDANFGAFVVTDKRLTGNDTEQNIINEFESADVNCGLELTQKVRQKAYSFLIL